MKIHRKAFTLVELIVVITILAILSTVWFIAFSGYLKWVRDTNRISQLKNMHDGMVAYQSRYDLILPEDYVEIKKWSNIIWYQWYAWEGILKKIEFSSKWLDPKELNYFTYAITEDKKHFSLMWFLEEQDGIEAIVFWDTAYAANYTKRYPYVTGKKIGILLDEDNNPIQENSTIQSQWYIDILNLWTENYQLYLSNTDIHTGSWSQLANLSTNYDCKRLQDMNGKLQDGLYKIDPDGDGTTTSVYCDMTTDWGGWTFTTMLADTTTVNLFSPTNANHTDFITSITEDISTKGKLSNIWTNNSNRDILLQCFSDQDEHVNYEEPFIIYDYLGTEKLNLTKDIKQSLEFSSINLQAKWKNRKFTLDTDYRSGSDNDMRIKDTNGDGVFLLMDDQLATEDNSPTAWVNTNSPAYADPNDYQDLSATVYCMSAIR